MAVCNLKPVKALIAVILIVTTFCLTPLWTFAEKVGLSYDGGINSGNINDVTSSKDEFEYKEVCFITGEPIVLTGTVTVNKSTRKDTVSITYRYDLKNNDKGAALSRNVSYNIVTVKNADGKETEEISLAKKPTEVIKIKNDTYTLSSSEFSYSRIVDEKPVVEYVAGNISGKKVYRLGNNNSNGTVTIEYTGRTFGYDQYWGSTETCILDYEISSRKKIGDIYDEWGGNARVTISSSAVKNIEYIENIPEQTSIPGGYLQTENISSILEYSCIFPEFDSNGVSTYRMIEWNDSLKLETFPKQKWLPVYDLSYLRGHWAENEIKLLYSLGAFKNQDGKLNPDEYITRAEFTAALINILNEGNSGASAPSSANTTTATRTSRISSRKGKAEEEIISPYVDVPADYKFFAQIKEAHEKGFVMGRTGDLFYPDDTITLAEVAVIFIRALGLKDLALDGYLDTFYRDDVKIPSYAKDAIYSAYRIGIIKGDEKGYIVPDEKITKAKAAVLLNNLINYMKDGIIKDYRERIFGYN